MKKTHRKRAWTGAYATAFVVGMLTALAVTHTRVAAAHNPGPPPIAEYIHASWIQLERSMTECKSLGDTKTNTAPVLYLPVGLAEPPAVHALSAACGIRVERLPKRIDHPGALLPSAIPAPGLLYLPHPYVVPGGRFNEQYGWDSYFILMGLLEDGHRDIARGMVENFFFEIENYGSLLNANRTYFLTRSQPPLLGSMIRMVYDADVTSGNRKQADTWLAGAYGSAVQDHALWLRPEHAAGGTGLARYHDLGEGPVPEMADASTYYPDVIRWLLDHPAVQTDDLVLIGRNGTSMREGASEGLPPTPEERGRLRQQSCDWKASQVCLHAHHGPYWLSRAFYEGDRADRESGFDTTFRFGPFSGSAEQYAPVCLNALLYRYELDLAWMAAHLGKPADAAKWRQAAAARRTAMDRYLWNPRKGLYFDYNYVTGQQSTYNYITTFYPLWAGAANPAQAGAVAANLPLFLRSGGVAVSTTESGVQWDLPYGWAPTTYFAVAGLERAGADAAARTVAQHFLATVRNGYRADGTIREKYNVVAANADVQVANGYKQNVIGFGWTNGVYLRFEHLLSAPVQSGAMILNVAAESRP